MALSLRERLRLHRLVDKQRYFYSRIAAGLVAGDVQVEGPHPIDGRYDVILGGWHIARVGLTPSRLAKSVGGG